MSQIENSYICSIPRPSTSPTGQQQQQQQHGTETNHHKHSIDRTSSLLDTQSSSTYFNNISTTNEKRLNYALKSKQIQTKRHMLNDDDLSDSIMDCLENSNPKSSISTIDNVDEVWQPGNNSQQAVENVAAAISSVELDDCCSLGENRSPSTSTSTTMEEVNQKENVAYEVETVDRKGGDELVGVEVHSSFGTTVLAADADTVDGGTVAVEILDSCKHDQSLKPILKRKEPNDYCDHPTYTTGNSLPPPILKKRDSFNSIQSESPQFTSVCTSNQQSTARPTSILKNRQPRGSYSFDDNVNESDSTTFCDESVHHSLKPILKKKSWSIDERVSCTNVVPSSILKSNDKLGTSISSSSSKCCSRKSSATDEIFISGTSSPYSNSTNGHLDIKAALKGILKTDRSRSISPSGSSELNINESDIEDIILPSSSSKFSSAIQQMASTEGEYHQTEMESDLNQRYSPTPIFDDIVNEQMNPSNITFRTISNPLAERISPQSVSSSCDSSSFMNDCLEHSPTTASSNSLLGMVSSESSSVESVSKNDEPDDSETKSEDDCSMSHESTFRHRNKPNDHVRSRPKSCFVTSNELFGVQTGSYNVDSPKPSIAERLALLKQNGEEGWKNRVNKSDVKREIQVNLDEKVQLRPKLNETGANRGSVIANRLSSLMESQSQWRCRVNENDAKQFTVASKQSRQLSTTESDATMDSNGEKVVLRGTPKRLGLRGSTLNETALSAVSSKLNSVLRSDKSLLSSPITPIRKKDDSSPSLLDVQLLSQTNSGATKASSSSSSNQTVFLSKPDDEETFGSFFELDNRKLDHLIGKQSENEVTDVFGLKSLESFDNGSTRLLKNVNKSRIQAPKRRTASSHNPIKQLNKSCISVDSYSNVPNVVPLPPSPPISEKASTPITKTPGANMALSALAGLASTEDFKSVASKLRNSSANGSLSGNDTWRAYDLKNSLQTKMLILVKGRRHAQIRLVKPDWHSINLVDSFILVTKDKVIAYVGQFSNIIERTKCMEVAEQIRKRREMCYRSQSNELTLIDGHTDSVKFNLFGKIQPLLKELDFTDSDLNEWEKMVNNDMIGRTNLDEEDELYEESLICTNIIFDVVFNEAKSNVDLMPVEQYWGRSPRHQMLQPESVFIFDFGTEMYIWIGKNVSNVHRKLAVDAAKELWLKGYDYSDVDLNPFGPGAKLKSNSRPDWAWFTRANQNMECTLFKDKFFNWPAFTLTRSVKHKYQNLASKNEVKEERNIKHTIVKKDLSQELNLFPVDVNSEMVNKKSSEPNFVLENVSLGRGTNDIMTDEDGLSVKIVSLDVNCFYIDECGERVELNKSDRNFLFTGESYYIRWKYRLTRISRCLKTGKESKFSEEHGGRDRLCYFVWQGKDARNTQRGTTALNAIDKLREEGASQEIVENGKEFPAFLRIFEGNLVILRGKRSKCNQSYRMFSLQNTIPEELFLVEIECSAKNLRSRSSFIFTNVGCSRLIYIWYGCKSSIEQRQATKKFLNESLLANKSTEFGFGEKNGFQVIEIEEGKESREFFNLFNNTTNDSPKRSSRSALQREIYFSLMDDVRSYNFTPRLFQFITSPERVFQAIELLPSYFYNGQCKVIDSYPFTQEDLYVPASTRPTFFLFDNHYEVYLWESKFPFFITDGQHKTETKDQNKSGPRMINIESEILSEVNLTTGSSAQLWLAERKCALESALAYCHAINSTEPPKAYVISAGLEPDCFIGLFPTWIYYDNVAQLHIEDDRKPGQQILVQEILSQIRDVHTSTYSYDLLKKRPLPEGINILCLESYLDDQEFEKLFGVNREEFYSLPTWKQKILKQEKELF